MSIIVQKFGGSSLSDAAQFKKVYDIVKSSAENRYIVPSAPGKRFSNDIKVTDMLYACYDKAAEGEEFYDDFARIEQRYTEIITELGLDLDLSAEFAKIRSAFENHSGSDFAASRGEYLNGIILAKYLGYYFMDAAKCVRFNDDGTFNAEFTFQKTREHLSAHEYAVIPGFYGKMPNDTIKTFSRGGSDITGSLIARAVGAKVYQNWTDVDGFLVTDPRIVENPKLIETITYRELRELSYMGASVLHEEAIFPVQQAGIPINIRNTNAPENRGTMIVASADSTVKDPHITGIAGKKGLVSFLIEKAMMNSEIGFGRKVLEIVESYGISFEHLPSSIDTMCVIIDGQYLKGREDAIAAAIKEGVKADSVHIERGLALIAIVGRGMRETTGTAAKVMTAVAKERINLRMIDQGSSELNIIIGIDDSCFETAIRSIYNEFNN